MKITPHSSFRLAIAGVSIMLLALLAVSCRSEKSADEKAITAVARAFVEESMNGDTAKAYQLLSAVAQSRCSEADFSSQLLAVRDSVTRTNIKVGFDRLSEFSSSGNDAIAKIETTANGKRVAGDPPITHFVKENGVWRVTGDTPCLLN